MAREFEVQNAEEFEKLIKSRDFRVYEALVSTVLKNLTSKKRHHHALSVISTDEDAVYDITIDSRFPFLVSMISIIYSQFYLRRL